MQHYWKGQASIKSLSNLEKVMIPLDDINSALIVFFCNVHFSHAYS